MKKLIAALLCLCLLLPVTAGLAQATPIGGSVEEPMEEPVEEPVEEDDNWDAFFRSMEGRIAYTLPSVPTVIREPDLDDDEMRAVGWKNKLQLMAKTDGGGEFFVHAADLSPAMDRMREDHPGEDEFQYQMNALMNLAMFYIDLYDGEITMGPDYGVFETEEKPYLDCRFTFVYPDDPTAVYQARGIMDGALAVLILAQEDADSLRILETMHVATAAEAEAFRNRPAQALRLGDMRVTFPVPADVYQAEDGSAVFADAFTGDYAYLSAEYMEYPLWIMLDRNDPNASLEDLVRGMAQSYLEEGVLESYTVEQVADRVYRYEGLYPEEWPLSVREIIQGYVTPYGVYTVHSADTEAGRAFLDSIVIPAEGE